MNLKTYISEKKLTIKQVGKSIGVTPAAVSRYANGQRMPRAEVMRKIVEATNGSVQPNDFFEAE